MGGDAPRAAACAANSYGGGIGHDVLRRPRIDLQFLGGLTFVRSSFANGELRRDAEALLGQKLTWRVANGVNLGHSLDFYPNLSESGDYRFNSTTTLSTRISSVSVRSWPFGGVMDKRGFCQVDTLMVST